MAQRTDLNALMEEVRRDLLPECAGRSIAWRLGELPGVECDARLIRQVFANLGRSSTPDRM